ncbi:MAG TPA: hypothetical protein DIU15_04465 [Deltaproteobacteria bacterium]|nr:hypothetical protein [Deltaproteobacteria bacterium]HCP45267.1 hypothetical protein [Deltaproteobacteria bacterium]
MDDKAGRRWTYRVAGLAFLLLALTSPRAAHPYGIDAHRALVELALEPTESMASNVQGVDESALSAFRRHLFSLASETDDPSLREAFLKLWPSAENFGPKALKQLAGLSVEADVHGIDVGGPTMPAKTLLAEASVWPDTDHRNRNRLLMGDDGLPVVDSWNRSLPLDPATLDMGARTGLSSQAHAHYQLWPGERTESASVLRTEPWRFSRPSDAHSFGADFAQSYTDLAAIAAHWDHPAAPWLELAWTGAAYHHIQDTANTLHTLQVGSFDYFVAATRAQLLGDLWTLGGLLGPRQNLRDIGIRLLRDHHIFAEELWAERVRQEVAGHHVAPEPNEAVLFLDPIGTDDSAFLGRLEKATLDGAQRASQGDFGRRITFVLAAVGGPEGAQVYDQAWRLASTALKTTTNQRTTSPKRNRPPPPSIEEEPKHYLHPKPWTAEYEALLSEFYELQLRGMQRAGTAMRLWSRLHRQVVREEHADQRVMNRWLRERLTEERARTERREHWTPSAPSELGLDLRVPGTLMVTLALLVWGLRALLRSMKARRRARGGPSPN